MKYKKVKDNNIGPNEEFVCGYCNKKLTGRYIFCSQECEDNFNKGVNDRIIQYLTDNHQINRTQKDAPVI